LVQITDVCIVATRELSTPLLWLLTGGLAAHAFSRIEGTKEQVADLEKVRAHTFAMSESRIAGKNKWANVEITVAHCLNYWDNLALRAGWVW
jgi:2-methylcitrate dehydratase PrpD